MWRTVAFSRLRDAKATDARGPGGNLHECGESSCHTDPVSKRNVLSLVIKKFLKTHFMLTSVHLHVPAKNLKPTGCFSISLENKPNLTRNGRFFDNICKKTGKGVSQLARFFWKMLYILKFCNVKGTFCPMLRRFSVFFGYIIFITSLPSLPSLIFTSSQSSLLFSSLLFSSLLFSSLLFSSLLFSSLLFSSLLFSPLFLFSSLLFSSLLFSSLLFSFMLRALLT